MYDFDTIIDRRHTDSYKWNTFRDRDVIPMPVADMDFASPEPILEAIRERVNHGIFGYAAPPASAVEAVTDMLRRDFDWEVKPHWLVWIPGLETGLNLFCRIPEANEAVITSTPIYPPFLSAAPNMGRRLERVPLAQDGTGRYVMDMNALASCMEKPDVTGLMLCNPHNPSGRVYTRQELSDLAEVCLRHNIVVCADEIHCGLILDQGLKHIPFATLSEEVADRTITLMSPSKTFNLAGLKCAFAIIPNTQLRAAFKNATRGLVTELNVIGYAACEAAYRHCGDWHHALLHYLRENRDLVEQTLGGRKELTVNHSEATYLAWIDCRGLGADDPYTFFLEHGVSLSDGKRFDGPGFVRLNFGCPRTTLREGLARIESALAGA